MWLRWSPIALGLTALALATPSGADVVVNRACDDHARDWVLAPSIAFDGTSYVVAWVHAHQVGRPIYASVGICGARVSRAGGVRDRSFTIVPEWNAFEGYANPQDPSVAFGDSNSLVVWIGPYGSPYGDVFGSRVTPSGDVLDEAGRLRLTSTSGRTRNPALAFDGTNHLVVFDSGNDLSHEIFGVLVNSSGRVLRKLQISNRERQSNPIVAFDGTNFLVVWKGGCAGLCGARVSPSGVVLDGAGIPIWGFGLTSDAKVAVAFDGTNYLVVWEGPGPEIAFTRVSPAGNVLDPGGIALGRGSSPSVAFYGRNYLVAWRHLGDQQGVYLARVSPSGAVLDPAGFRISRRSTELTVPAVASDGTTALVVWPDGASTVPSRIVAARVDSMGRILPSDASISRATPIRCVVPGVVGLRLAPAKARIRDANCRLGRLRHVRSSRVGRVLGQSPRAGVRRPRGSRVKLVVGIQKH